MADEPVPEPKTPETPAAPSDAIAAAPPAPADSPAAPGTSIAAGPAPQVLFTPDPSAPVPPTTQPAAKPGEELIGSWLSAHLHRTDKPYAVLALVLAFLLGSFAAFNADIWMQLATGRLLSEGEYQFGVDPFAYTTHANASMSRPAVMWINHSWLFAWASYLLYSVDSSGAVLVILKALMVAGVGLLLLFMRPMNRHGWAGTLIVLLALVVMSPRFELQPVIFSILFLTLTMFILVRAGVFADAADGEGEMPAAHPGMLWALPVLFALWVNLDSYFILGPLTVLLCLLALLIAKAFGHKSAVCLRRLSAVLAISVAACFLNPHHYRAVIRMPAEIGYLLLHTGDFWPQSVVAGGQAYMDFQARQPNFNRTLSPLSTTFVTEAEIGKNVAGIGFFVLLAVVVLPSFYFCRPKSLSTLLVRLVPTLFFGILALMLARLIPFFAVVGSAVSLLNIQEYLARRETQDPAFTEEHNVWANLTRLATGFLLFGLLFLAWPGWVNTTVGVFDGQRRVAWRLHEDVSLKNTVKYLEKMHEEKKLDRCLNLSPDVASYGAWYAPGISFFMDPRYELFDRDARAFQQIRESLILQIQGKAPTIEWPKEFARHKIDHVAGSGKLALELSKVSWAFPLSYWLSIYADGKSFVVAYKPAMKKPATETLQSVVQQWRQQAFGPHEAAWETMPPPLETDPSFWELYAFGQSQQPLAAQDAEMLLIYNQWVRTYPPWLMPYLAATHLGNLIQPFGPNLWSRFTYLAEDPRELFQKDSKHVTVERLIRTGGAKLVSLDDGDPAAALLALRKARQAIAENPNRGNSYSILADAIGQIDAMENRWNDYQQRQTPRQSSASIDRDLATIRRFQYIAAVKHSVTVQPDDEAAQFRMAQVYVQQNCLDLALVHLRKSVELLESTRGLPQEAMFQKKNQRENMIAELQPEVEKRLADLESQSRDAAPLKKAEKAVFEPYFELVLNEATGREEKRPHPEGMGLIGTAQKILLEIPAAQLDAKSGHLLLRLNLLLALKTGDLALMDRILADMKDNAEQFRDWAFFLNAANGNYEKADEFLADMDSFLDKQMAATRKQNELGIQQQLAGLLSFSQPIVSERALFAYCHGPSRFPFNYEGTASFLLFNHYVPAANRRLLRAVFALEAGNTVNARKRFKETLDFIGPNMFFFDRKIAERYQKLLEP